MCNNLKNGSRVYKIPEYGFGYKVFIKKEGGLKSHVMEQPMLRNRWIKWNSDMGNGDGFCFLHNLRAVKVYLKEMGFYSWEDIVCKIRYRRALGKRREHPALGAFMSSLCKEFKILNEVDIKDLK